MRFKTGYGLILALSCSLMLAGAQCAFAGYPEKPIKVYYGYSAGGTCHTSLQPLMKAFEKEIGTPVALVEKKGASATICGGAVSKAKPDGYTLGVIKATTITTAPHVLRLPYSPSSDLTHIYAYAGPPSGFAVKADASWKTWKEYIAYAKENPGKVAWTAVGTTGTQFLVMKYIGEKEGIKWNGVPAQGGSAAMKLVLGGQVTGYAGSGSHIPQIKSGNARELLDFGDKSAFEGVPTIAEEGYPQLTIHGEPYIIVGPKELPADIEEKIVTALEKAAKDSSYLDIVEKLDMQPANLSGKQLEEMLSSSGKLVEMLLQASNQK